MTIGKRRLVAASASAALLAAGVAAVATADHGGPHGLSGLFNSRGASATGSAIDDLKLRDRATGLKIQARDPVDVVVVGAQLSPWVDGDGHTHPGETGWHSHPAQSVATVQPGGPALKMYELIDGRCVASTIPAGRAFLHPAHAHNLVNEDTSQPLRFGVAYFVPVGAALLTPEPAPAGCGEEG